MRKNEIIKSHYSVRETLPCNNEVNTRNEILKWTLLPLVTHERDDLRNDKRSDFAVFKNPLNRLIAGER